MSSRRAAQQTEMGECRKCAFILFMRMKRKEGVALNVGGRGMWSFQRASHGTRWRKPQYRERKRAGTYLSWKYRR